MSSENPAETPDGSDAALGSDGSDAALGSDGSDAALGSDGSDAALGSDGNGAPLTASFGDQVGDEAVLRMLALNEGRYTFAAGDPEGVSRSIAGSVTALLLQASRIRDELNRA